MIKRIKKSESVKNEYVHKGANRLVHDISRSGEDQLDIRTDFFVLYHNRKADKKLGRVDGATVGLPHEMAFFNILCPDACLVSSPSRSLRPASRDSRSPCL